MTQTKTPPPASPARPNIKQLFNISPVGMVGSFSVGIIHGIFYSLSPIYAVAMGLPTEKTALFMALSLSSGMLLQIPLGRLSDRIDRRWIIALSSGLTVIACYLLFEAKGHNVAHVLAVAVFYGSTAFTINPLCMAHVNDLAPPNERTQTASGLLMIYGIGAVSGPVLAGLILPFGAQYIFLISGSVMMLFSAYTLLRLLIKPRQLDRKSRFKPFSINSPARRLSFSSKQRKE